MSCEDKVNGCPPVPDPPEDKPFLYVSEMLKAIGAELPCYTDRSYTVEEVSMYGLNVSSKVKDRENISTNCEDIQAVAKTYKNSQNKITCVLRQTCNKQTVSMASLQNIMINCPVLKVKTIRQASNNTLITSFNLNEEEVNQISNEIKQTVEEMANVLKKPKGENSGTDKGTRTAQYLKEVIDSIDYSSAIKLSIREFNNYMKLGQTMNIEGEISCDLNNITQEIQAKMLAQSMMDGVFKNSFKTILTNISTQESKAIQKRIEEDERLEKSKTIIKYITIGVVIFFVLLILIVILIKVSKSKQQDYYPYG